MQVLNSAKQAQHVVLNKIDAPRKRRRAQKPVTDQDLDQSKASGSEGEQEDEPYQSLGKQGGKSRGGGSSKKGGGRTKKPAKDSATVKVEDVDTLIEIVTKKEEVSCLAT